MIILKELFKDKKKYKKFIKTIQFDNMISYPIFIKKEYFLSEKISKLISNKNDLHILNIVKKSNIKEIKIEL